MTDNTQPEAREFTMSQYTSKDDMIGAMRKRIAELEAQLEAIGAGGVNGPLMRTPTSGAADLPEATATLIERLEDAVYEWGNYVDADHAPCPLTRHVDPHIKAIHAELQRLHAITAQAISAEPAGAWIERWHGSGGKEGHEGWSIVGTNNRSLVAYLGREVDSDAVTAIVMAHNALRATHGQAPAQPTEPHMSADEVRALPAEARAYIHQLAANTDPSGMVRENMQLRDVNAGLQIMYRKAVDAAQTVVGCFDAAIAEGLNEAIAETTDERLKDLLERRLMYALYAAQEITAEPTPIPQAADTGATAEPYGWLYDWTHSSATGRPDTTYTGFTKYEAHARKHDNCIAVFTAPHPAPAAGAVAGQMDDIDAVALARYKVEPSHDSMFHRFAVVAGDGQQQIYVGRETECQNMARKFSGAFLDGAFYQSQIAAAPTPAAQADSVLEDAARYRWLRDESWAGYNSGNGTPKVYTIDGAGNRKMQLAEDAMDSAVDAARAAQKEGAL